MKKNNMMRLASVLLVLVLLTTCAISGTFAKYTSEATGTDAARVAYWGFGKTATVAITDLFLQAYNGDGDLSVNSENGEDLIAPGTTNNKDFSFAWVGNTDATIADGPEVAYEFVVDVQSVCDPLILANDNIEWYLDNVKCTNFNDMVAKIKLLSGDASGTAEYGPGELPEAFEAGTSHNIKWNWVFHTDEGDDTRDTTMGNANTLDASGELDDVSITITITATQLDTYTAPATP